MARLEIDILANLKELHKNLNDAESGIQKFASKAQAVGAGLTLALTVPILAVGKASLKAASDAEETFSKFNVVFRDVAKNAEDSFQTLRGEYGLSGLAAKQLLSDTGDLLTGFGFSQTAALDLATQVNKLAVDLASFTNFSGGAEGASNALTKALLGERESLKALGISILEEDVKKQVAINTAKGLIFETERQAKAYATLDIAVAQSQNAIGDYSRTSEGYANQQRLLSARIEDLSVSIGSVFLPVANKLTGVFLRVTETLNSLSSETKQTIVIMAGIAAAIGPVLLAIGTAIKLIPVLTAGFVGLKGVIIAATGPFGLIAIAIAASIPLLFELYNELERTSKIAGEVKVDLLAESLKSSREEFERLSKSLESTGLKPLEAQNRAIDLLLKQELNLLNVRGKQNKDIDAIKARVAALNQLKLEINKVDESAKSVVTTFEEFSKLSDIKNEEVFRKWTEEADRFNDAISETIRIQKSIEDVSFGIAATLDKPISDIGIDVGGPPIVEIPDFDDSKATDFILRLKEFRDQVSEVLEFGIENTLGDFAFSIGEALGSGGNVIKSAGAALLGGIAAIMNQLGQLAIGAGIAIGGIKKALLTLNPAVAIGAGVALIGLAGFISSKAKSLGGGMGSGGGGGGGNISSGGASQSFGGTGVGINNQGIELIGEFVVRGSDLVYVISKEDKKRKKG